MNRVLDKLELIQKLSKKDRIINSILIVVIIFGFLLKFYNSLIYPLEYGHDGPIHMHIINSVLAGKGVNYYCGLYYYIWCILHVGLEPLFYYVKVIFGLSSLHNYLLGLANLHLFFWMLAGFFTLSRKINFSLQNSLLFIAIIISLPTIHRSFNMIRPENFILGLLPWIINFWLKIIRNINLNSFLILLFSLLCAIISTQKITAISVVLCLFFTTFLLCFQEHDKRILKKFIIIVFSFVLFVFLFYLLHSSASNILFHQHHADNIPKYAHKAPLSFFYNFNIIKIWQNPFRNNLKNSLFGILLTDFYGDYWKYSFDHYKVNPEIKPFIIARIQIGIVGSLLFFSIFLASIFRLCISFIKGYSRKSYWFILNTLIIFSGFLIIILSSQKYFNPRKADIVKWEYIIWIVPFIVLSIINFYSNLKSSKTKQAFLLVFILLMFIGVINSILPSFGNIK